MRFIHFFRCFLSVYTQYLWPISPMQCFYGLVPASCNHFAIYWFTKITHTTLYSDFRFPATVLWSHKQYLDSTGIYPVSL